MCGARPEGDGSVGGTAGAATGVTVGVAADAATGATVGVAVGYAVQSRMILPLRAVDASSKAAWKSRCE